MAISVRPRARALSDASLDTRSDTRSDTGSGTRSHSPFGWLTQHFIAPVMLRVRERCPHLVDRWRLGRWKRARDAPVAGHRRMSSQGVGSSAALWVVWLPEA